MNNETIDIIGNNVQCYSRSQHYNEFGKKRIESTNSFLSQFAVVLFGDHKQPERKSNHHLLIH